jgi:hypothetical protein
MSEKIADKNSDKNIRLIWNLYKLFNSLYKCIL